MGAATRQDHDQARAGIAILGGSFDPPHSTHVRLAREALTQLPVSEVLVIPAGDHPHKQDRGMSTGSHRLAMCRLAFGELAGVTVDDREIRRSGLSFTADTLAELAGEHPDRQLHFLIGSDNLPLLPTWRDHHRILALATIVTWPRAGYPVDVEQLRKLDLTPTERERLQTHVLPMPADAVAATDLRQRLADGSPTPELAPAVAAYAATHALYDAR